MGCNCKERNAAIEKSAEKTKMGPIDLLFDKVRLVITYTLIAVSAILCVPFIGLYVISNAIFRGGVKLPSIMVGKGFEDGKKL